MKAGDVASEVHPPLTTFDRPEERSRRGIVRQMAALAIAVSGSLASIRGWGPVVIYPDVQSTASWVILALGGAFVVLAPLHRALWLTVARVALVVALPLATWGNAGRAYGLVSASGLVVLHSALVERWPPRCSAPGAVEAGVLAAAFVAAGQVLCARGRPLAAAPAIVLGAAVLVGHRIHPHRFGRADGLVGRCVDPARRAGAAVLDTLGHHIRSITSFGRRHPSAVAVVAGVAAAMAPVFWRYASGAPDEIRTTDYMTHLEHAGRVELLPLRVTTPHPAFHVSVRAVSSLMGQAWATTVVLTLAAALTAAVLVSMCLRPFADRPPVGPTLGAVFAVGYFLVESPAQVAAAFEWGNPRSWAPMNHMVLSPTDTLLVPFGLLLVMSCASILGAPRERTPSFVKLGCVTLVATLVKPTVTLPLVLVLPVLAAAMRRWEPWRWRLITSVLVPAAAVTAWQTWFIQAGAGGHEKSSVAIRPLETVRLLGLDEAGPLLIAPVLVVVLCLWVDRRRYLREPAVRLALGCMAVALAMLLLLNETGPRAPDGTFAKPAFACWVVLHVMSWRFLLPELAAALRSRRPPAWALAGGCFLALCVVAGVLSYLGDVGLMQLPQRTSTGWASGS